MTEITHVTTMTRGERHARVVMVIGTMVPVSILFTLFGMSMTAIGFSGHFLNGDSMGGWEGQAPLVAAGIFVMTLGIWVGIESIDRAFSFNAEWRAHEP